MHKKIVIFDLDGTLFQTESVCLPSMLKALSELNIKNVIPEKIISMIGEQFHDFARLLLPDQSPTVLEEFMKKTREYEVVFLKEKGVLYPGIVEMLKELKSRDFSLAICSNGSREYVQRVLNTFKITHYFDFIEGRKADKPKADVLREIIKRTTPKFAIMIGDRKHDFNAANENNIPSIGVTYGYGKEEMRFADYVANNSKEILSGVFRLEKLKNKKRMES